MAYMRMLCELRRRWPALRDTLPLACVLCHHRTPGGLCKDCRVALNASSKQHTGRCPRCDLLLNAPSTCPDCQALPESLLGVVAAFDYVWPGDFLIKALKQGGRFSIAPVLAGLMAERWRARHSATATTWLTGQNAVLTAVPASRHALAQRGYNPAAELGRALAPRLGLSWQPGLLRRTEDGQRQKHLNRRARQHQVRGLYHCPGGAAGKQVLVVDDVMTTGSTLSAIAEALSAQGAAGVWGVVVARTPMRTEDAQYRLPQVQ